MAARSNTILSLVAALLLLGCGRERDMPEKAEMPDSMPVARAMHDAGARDSMLDTIPGGEMARGDSASAMKLLKKKNVGPPACQADFQRGAGEAAAAADCAFSKMGWMFCAGMGCER